MGSSDCPPVPRLRGRAGVAQRLRRLRAEPLCRDCKARGQIAPAIVPDHIVPLALGGSDDDSNIQCLCTPCHAFKTAAEGAATGGAANHPDWLQPSAIPLTIVCGPPCSGKTTYVVQHASPTDTVIDLDAILMRLEPSYRHWSGMLSQELLNKAIRVRNAMLGSLDRQTAGRAWFIVSAPTKAERDWWQRKLGGELILLHPGAGECKRRAIQRGTPEAGKGVDEWEKARLMPWSPPQAKARRVAIGVDGWPQ